MEPTFNPVSTSGIGFKLEHFVQSSFLLSLLLETPFPFENEMEVIELKFQAKHIANTDDLIVHFRGNERNVTFYVQSKKGLEINRNETFDELIDSLWKDFNQDGFDKEHTKFIVTTDILNKVDAEDGLLVLEWARSSKDWQDFDNKIKNNKKKLNKLNYFIEAIRKVNTQSANKELVWAFLSSIFIKTYDYLETGSKDKEILKWYFKPFLKTGLDAELVLLDIIGYVQRCNQNGATITKQNVELSIKEHFDLTKSPKLNAEIKELFKKSISLVKYAIHNDIDGLHLDKSKVFLQISELLAEKRFIIISGIGGIGKSAVAKDYFESSYLSDSAYLAFKADLFDRSSLAHSLSDVGVLVDFETIISQWLLFPKLVVYIDSFEKLYESSHKEAFLEFLGKIKDVTNVKIIATCREYAIETLRSKYRISKQDIGIIPLSPLTATELAIISSEKKKLKNIIENPKLKKLVCIPFYLNMASQIVDSLNIENELSETDFRNAMWKFIIEKSGSNKLGQSRKRVNAFSSITIKRAIEKVPYVKPDMQVDLDIIAELELDGLLIKHPTIDCYAPAHDIFEDIVVVKYLHELFQNKINSLGFLTSIDNNPVFRRAIRLWIQELIALQANEANLFLADILPHHITNDSIVDEIIIGMLGADDPYSLLNRTKTILTSNNLQLFFKAFRLLKMAYVMEYEGENPERKIKTTGQGWSALLRIMDENYSDLKKWFDIVLVDLLLHWTFQYETDDLLPDEAKIVAKHCFSLLTENKGGYRFAPKRQILEILFSVAPAVKEDVKNIFLEAIDNKMHEKEDGAFPIFFYRDLFKMVLVDTVKCVNLYKLFPEIIIDLAKMEWFSDQQLHRHESEYLEASFGLKSYPYKYFSSSSFQTPFRYLFRYHECLATNFLIEISNRAVNFYKKSDYFQEGRTASIHLQLDDETKVHQFGDENLWTAYRGFGVSPCLIQSALMAYETHLLENIENLSPELFNEILTKSHSVMLTAVLSSVAMSYPLAFKDKILALFASRKLFLWDLGRYSNEMISSHHTEIGNEYYFTHERYLSNKLKHRKSNLENLVTKLQFYFPDQINTIIDEHVKTIHDADPSWKLALTRMDIRKTTPHIDEELHQITFTPLPLPDDLQEFVDEGQEDSNQYVTYISIVMWASKAFKNEHDEQVTFEQWKEKFETIKTDAFRQAQPFGKIDKSIAAIGLRDFFDKLDRDIYETLINDITVDLETTANQIKSGYFHSAEDIFYKADFSILPILLRPELKDFVSQKVIKRIILEFLVLLPDDEKKDLIKGIKTFLWDIDKTFAENCFQILLKMAKQGNLNQRLYQLRYSFENEDLLTEANKILDELINGLVVDLPSVTFLKDHRRWILYSLELLPDNLILTEYKDYFQRLILEIGSIKDLSEYKNFDFNETFKNIIANLLFNNADENAEIILLTLLSAAKKQPGFVLDTLKVFIFLGHDSKYPPNLWTHLNTLLSFVLQVSGKFGFVHILLFAPLSNPYRAYNLPDHSPGRPIHELIVSSFAADENLIEAVFKLLAGIGSIYQPVCLTWLMKSLPDRKAYTDIFLHAGNYFEPFVQQLYDDHIEHIRTNKEQLDYYMIMLDVLIERGSSIAFRIRDEII
ncbi:MAG TPA: hypothetical protein VMT76_00810 [Puia sp.]|nr:hypothetical protein [Puia sp.]